MGVFGSKPDISRLEADRDIDGLTRALDHGEADVRLAAAQALANFCPADACPALIARLSDENKMVRNAAVAALVATGESVIPLLFNAMGDQSWLVRRGATIALTKLRWTPDDDEIRICFLFAEGSWKELAAYKKKAIPYLIEGLKDQNPGIRKGAAGALGMIGDPDGFEPLTRAIADPETEVRVPAALALGHLKDPRAIPFLINLFYDSNAATRNAAADALATVGIPAFEPLVSALNDPRTCARLAAIRSLGRIRNRKVIPPLIGKLEDTFPEVRTSAAVVLGEMGEPALPRILEVMKKGSRIARIACLDAFAKNLDDRVTAVLEEATRAVDEQIAQKAESVLRKREGLKVWKTSVEEDLATPVSGSAVEIWNIRQERRAFEQIGSQETEKVTAILRDDDQMRRLREILRIINENRPVVEALIMILRTKDEEVRRRAAEAINRLEGISGNPFIVALHDQDPFIRAIAAKTLGRLGWTDAILPLLHAICEEKDTFVRGSAIEAITTMAMQADLKMPVTDVLVRALTDDSAAIRAQSAEILGDIGSVVAVPALISLFRDRDDGVRERAADAFGSIGKQAFPSLVHAAHDPDPRIRCGALTALSDFGRKGEVCINEALDDRNPDVREHARRVLASLKPDIKTAEPPRATLAGDRDGATAVAAGRPAGTAVTLQRGGEPADPADIIPLLASRDERERLRVADSLAAMGEAAFRPLIFAAYNPDRDMRIGALYALARFGTMGAPHILRALKDDDIAVQHAAYRILNRLDGRYGLPKTGGPALTVGTPAGASGAAGSSPAPSAHSRRPHDEMVYPADIIPRLADSSGHVRQRAIGLLVSMGEPAFLPLVYAAYHPDPAMRIGALQALVRFGAMGATYVAKGLEDDDIAVRNAVYRILVEEDGNYGLPRVRGPALSASMTAPEGAGVAAAAPAQEPAVDVGRIRDPEELVGLLDHRDRDVQISAAVALAGMGAVTVPALIAAFTSRSRETRATAAEILSSLGKDAVSPLISALSDPCADVVSGAASALGQLGDRRAVPALIDLLEKDRGTPGLAAADALGYLGDAASVGALIRALNGQDTELQSGAARALGYIGDDRAVSSLIEALGSEDFSLRRIATDALVGIGKSCIPYLAEALLHSERGVRSGAAECIMQMGYVPGTGDERISLLVANEEWAELAKQKPFPADILVHFTDDANVEVRAGSMTALAKAGEPRATETLARLLADHDPLIRRKAAFLLAGMGGAAIPCLRKARDEAESPGRRHAIERVLEKLDTEAQPGTARQ